MFEYLKYVITRHRMTRSLERGYKIDAKNLAEARSRKANAEEIEKLNYEAQMDNMIFEHELSQLDSRYLCRKAHKYRLPIPPHSNSEMWEESHVIGGWFLTTKGFATLRGEIRKEQNDRWQYVELRTKVLVALATSLTGLIGVLIGWAAFVK